MLTRKRTRGSPSPSIAEVDTRNSNVTFEVRGYCPAEQFMTIPATLPQVFTCNFVGARYDEGFQLPASLFDWYKPKTYWYPKLKSGSGTEITNLVLSSPTFRAFLHKYTGEPILKDRIERYNFEEMTDVIGSGFPTKRSKEFIVNPCTSERNLFMLTSSVASDSSEVVSEGKPATLSVRDLSIVVTASRVGKAPFSGAAFNIYRNSWLPEADPKRFGFLYSQACEDITAADYEVLAAIGELKETVSYLYSKLNAVAKILMSIRRGNFSFIKNWKNLSKADLWLEARYAIRPLYYDIQSIISALRNDGKLKFTLSKSRCKNDAYTDQRSFSFSSDGWKYDVVGTYQCNVRGKGGAYARLAMDLEFAYKYGTLNIASSAWELVPYSFIVDWFFSVSSFIAGLNPNPIYTVENGFVSINAEDLFSGTIQATSGTTTQGFGFTDSVHRYSRLPYSNRFNIALDINLNFQKFVDLALIFGRR